MGAKMKIEAFDSIAKGIDRCHQLQGKHDFVGLVPRYYFDREFAVLVYGKPKGSKKKAVKEFLNGELAVYWTYKKEQGDTLNEFLAKKK
jgi:hypothetical protein